MSRVYHFEENIGRSIVFNPESDVLVIIAGSPDDIVVSALGSDLTLATPEGMVTLKSVGLHQLNPRNVSFTPAQAIAAKIVEKPQEIAVEIAEELVMDEATDDLFAFAANRKPANSQGPQTPDLFTGKVEEPAPVKLKQPMLPIVEISSLEAANCSKASSAVYSRKTIANFGKDYVLPPHMAEDSGLDMILPVFHPQAIEFSSAV